MRWADYETPPASNANYAWILHILHHLKPADGVAGFLLANGALNDSDTTEIRKKLIQNDKVEAIIVLPRELKKHLLIQTISRVNRKYPGKDFGMIIDYIGIRDNMREAMKVYGGDTSVAPTSDDVEQASSVFREELEILKTLFADYNLAPFLNPECDPVERYKLLAQAAEYVFASTEALQI